MDNKNMDDRTSDSRFEDVAKMTEEDVRRTYSAHVNPDLINTLSLVGFDKVYTEAKDCTVTSGGIGYLDFAGGYGSLAVGHNNPEVAEAIRSVMNMPNLLQASLHPYAAALAQAVAEVLPGSLNMSFFCNSGTEAVEGALKLARIATGREKIISTDLAFHGKTMGSLSATGKKKYKQPFEPLIPGFDHIPYADLDALESALSNDDVAAFIVEPIQGEAGIIVPFDGYLKGASQICGKHGTLLIVDEIQSGMGRTGTMFAFQHEDIVPDIVCLAKSLSGGYIPSGAYCFSSKLWERSYSGMDRSLLHTSTFGGNTLAAAAGLKTLDILTRDNSKLIKDAADKGRYFIDKALKIKETSSLIKDVRGRGLMIGIEFAKPEFLQGSLGDLYHEYFASLVASELLNEHHILTVYTLNNPNVIRIEPPLTVTYEMLDEFLIGLEKVCSKNWASELVGSGIKAGVRAAKSWLRKRT